MFKCFYSYLRYKLNIYFLKNIVGHVNLPRLSDIYDIKNNGVVHKTTKRKNC